MLWAIYCIDKANTATLREQKRRPHRAYLDQRSAIFGACDESVKSAENARIGTI